MKPQRSLLPPLLTRRSRWELFVGVAEQCEHSRARTEQFAHVATHRVSPPIPSRGQPPSRRSSHPLRAFWTSSTTHPQHLSHPPRTISHADAPALQKLPDFLARPHQSQLLLRLSLHCIPPAGNRPFCAIRPSSSHCTVRPPSHLLLIRRHLCCSRQSSSPHRQFGPVVVHIQRPAAPSAPVDALISPVVGNFGPHLPTLRSIVRGLSSSGGPPEQSALFAHPLQPHGSLQTSWILFLPCWSTWPLAESPHSAPSNPCRSICSPAPPGSRSPFAHHPRPRPVFGAVDPPHPPCSPSPSWPAAASQLELFASVPTHTLPFLPIIHCFIISFSIHLFSVHSLSLL